MSPSCSKSGSGGLVRFPTRRLLQNISGILIWVLVTGFAVGCLIFSRIEPEPLVTHSVSGLLIVEDGRQNTDAAATKSTWRIPFLILGLAPMVGIGLWLGRKSGNSTQEQIRLNQSSTTKYRSSPTCRKELDDLESKLQLLMLTRKPYLQPNLSLAELSELINSDPHTLSRLINERYSQNFFHFVNSFRIKEFIMLKNSGDYDHYTFLALAFEVGFNNKTSFNKAFKLNMGKSPSLYFREQ